VAIITISHQLGSGGGDIASGVAERLGYRRVGAEVLAEAAHTHGLAEDRLTRLGEAKPPLLDRLSADVQTYIAVMQNAVLDAALQDDVVLLGRGGQWLLRGIPHVLRVRVIAPFDERVRRLADSLVPAGGRRPGVRRAPEALADLVRRDDADKRGRMRYLYDRDLHDPELYDIVIDTDRVDVEGAIAVIVMLARRPGLATTSEGLRRLVDRTVPSNVRVALMMDEQTRAYKHYEIEADKGVIRVTSGAPAVVAEAVARTVAGVKEVQVAEVPIIPQMPLD
jgi:cytidylate kinase